jgi:hypothetical protein
VSENDKQSIDMDATVANYLVLRNKRDQLLQAYKESDAEIKGEMGALELEMLAVCNTLNVSNLRTSHGTVMRKLDEKYGCTDWTGFYDFVLEHKVPELLEKRVHQTNLKEFMHQHADSGLPPGVNVFREYSISVRKATGT